MNRVKSLLRCIAEPFISGGCLLLLFATSFPLKAEDSFWLPREWSIKRLWEVNSPAFPKVNILALPPLVPGGCPEETRLIDTDGDGATEQYRMVFLGDCGGINFLPSIKNQIGLGACSEFATTAVLETMAGILFNADRPASVIDEEFLSTDLSELFNFYGAVPRNEVFKPNSPFGEDQGSPRPFTLDRLERGIGVVVEQSFPYYEMLSWHNYRGRTPSIDYWNLLSQRYAYIPECTVPSYNYTKREKDGSWNINYDWDVNNCLTHVAYREGLLTVAPTGIQAITFDNALSPGCVDVDNNLTPILCPINPTAWGGISDSIQPDYYQIEQQMRETLKNGYPLTAGVHWAGLRDNPSVISPFVSPGKIDANYYFKSRHQPILANLAGEPCSVDAPCPDVVAEGITFHMWGDHTVVIVGFLANTCWDINHNNTCDAGEDLTGDGRCTPRDCAGWQTDWLIIKNSHGERQADSPYWQEFQLIRVPSSFDKPSSSRMFPARAEGSTQTFLHAFSYGCISADCNNSPIYGYYSSPRVEDISLATNLRFARIDSFIDFGDGTGPIAQVVIETPDQDSDGDGIWDIWDNCPFTNSANLADEDRDGIGDVCDHRPRGVNDKWEDAIPIDDDGDGVNDEYDPCPRLASVRLYDPSEDDDKDGISNQCDNCPLSDKNRWEEIDTEVVLGYTGSLEQHGAFFHPDLKKYTKRIGSKFYWQPDHDLDGKGDVCDSSSAQVEIPLLLPLMDDTVEAGFMYCGTYGYLWQSIQRSDPADTTYVTSRYCWVRPDQQDRWGEPGLCTIEKLPATSTCHYEFGYSHGSDPYAFKDQIETWREISWASTYSDAEKANRGNFDWTNWTITGANLGSTVNTAGYFRVPSSSETAVANGLYWHWRRDMMIDDPLYSLNKTGTPFDATDSLLSWGVIPVHFYVALSAGIKGPSSNYLTAGNAVNPDFFRHDRKFDLTETPVPRFARSHRLQNQPLPLSYYKLRTASLPTWPSILGVTHLVEPKFSEIMFDDRDPQLKLVQKWRMNDIGQVEVSYKHKSENLLALVPAKDNFNYGIEKNSPVTGGGDFYTLAINYPNSHGDWHPQGTLTLPYDGENLSIDAYYHDGETLFAVATHTVPVTGIKERALYRAQKVSFTQDPECYLFPKFDWELIKTADLDSTMTSITLHEFKGKIVGLGNSPIGMKMFRLDGKAISTIEVPPATGPRDFYNAAIIGDAIYLVGGKNSSSTFKDAWRYTEEEGWLQIASNLNADLLKVFIAGFGDRIYFTSQIAKPGNLFDQVTMKPDGSDITIGTITIETLSSPLVNYCLLEENSLLRGGTMQNNLCSPFTHPWYKSFSIGTTIYSVAGKGDRLYVGTNSTIRVYDISDPNAMVLKSTFTTNRRVYDLEPVEGDIMYAATSGGIYKLNTANPNTLTQISFYSTPYNYQYRIQYYNDKLYVGDDNGINVRHKDTFARLAYVNFGSVVDFAIANGELALYWYGWWWDEGVQVRDDDTLTLKAYEYGYCSTGELTTDHGAFYLACDGYEYRFAGRPDTYIDFWELNGDIREMTENHLYNGWVYIPDGSAVKVSTNNEMPSYCGNGIVEPGEVCDGNSVYCEDLDPNEWNSGTATCNSTCTGWNTGNCYWSGC